MNRTLRRPMFRMGGTAEGITSGLQPRQGLAFAGVAGAKKKKELYDPKPDAPVTGDAWDKFKKSFPEIRKLAAAEAYKPRGTNVYDFMTEFGLDIASRPTSGNIWTDIATSAKDPYSRFMERKQSAAEQEYGSESDMFKTMLSSYGDILAAKEEAGVGEKSYQIKVKAGMVRDSVKKISNLERKINNGEDTDGNLAIELEAERINLNNLSKDDPYVDALLGNKEYVGDFIDEIMKELEQEMGPDGNPKWTGVSLYQEAQRRFREYIQGRQPSAKGGRIGYQNAGAVMPGATQATSTGGYDTSGLQGYDTEGGFQPSNLQGFPDQGEEVPEELQNIDFDTLRARLPSTITDDIVRLIATSAEAMEDFATIQTQQDINNFNEKYGVELVLPAEA